MIIPYLSNVKSAQQICGSLVKRQVSRHHHVTPARVFHVTVMPCYDKKLEASREDFYNDVYNTRDVDIVLTTGEIASLLSESGMSLKDFVESNEQTPAATDAADVTNSSNRWVL